MQGRRVYPPEPNEEMPHPIPWDIQPGDYWFSPVDGKWYFCCPKGGSIGNLANHQVTEHEDGTITVSPSILVESPWQPQKNWHGYLEHGIWKEV